MSSRSLFLFRRDLRLIDNSGLAAACDNSESVVPAFIFDPRQCDPEENSFFSEHAFTFMVRSLHELRDEFQKRGGRLFIFEGNPVQVVRQLLRKGDVSAVHVNRDYTPFSQRRDQALKSTCAEFGAPFNASNDLLLTEPENVQPKDGVAYHTFSPFRRHAQSQPVSRPAGDAQGPFYDGPVSVETVYLEKYNRHLRGLPVLS
ncbi:MAG: deoxyribodipyrimidine photo-lyase [Salinibacter sp.]